MATIREYFDTDFSVMSLHGMWTIGDAAGKVLGSFVARVHQDYSANAKFWSFFIPQSPYVLEAIQITLDSDLTRSCILTPEGDSVEVTTSFHGYTDFASSKTLLFTGRISFYVDARFDEETRRKIVHAGAERGYHVIVRDLEYAEIRSNSQKPLAFISHDSNDKDSLVRDLALNMTKLMCPVWYDEYSLKVGDSLRESIEKGLKETKKCVVVLSPNFLANGGWGKAEFDSIYTREIVEKGNVILPVWHGVTVKQVYDYSPRLADKVGLDSKLGIEALAGKLVAAVKQ